MTLEEAIIHCKERACDNTQCALEHRQLAEWLEELKEYRKNAKRGNKMKAPNKIYVPILPRIENSIISEHCVGTAWENKEHITIPDIEEYIRKDVVDETIEIAEDHAYFAGRENMREELLEWAKKTLEILNTDRGINEDFRKGAASELEEVIDRINKM